MPSQLPILLAEDLSTSPQATKRSKNAQKYAEKMSRLLKTSVEIAHVEDLADYSRNYAFAGSHVLNHLEIQKARLENIAHQFQEKTKVVQLEGTPIQGLIKLLKKNRYQLVVQGCAGKRGLKRLFVGSVAEEVIRHASVPVMTISSMVPSLDVESDIPKKILLGTDLGGNSKKAEKYAMNLARDLNAEVVICHCLYEGYEPMLQWTLEIPQGPAMVGQMFERSKRRSKLALKRLAQKFKKNGIKCSYHFDEHSVYAHETIAKFAKKEKPFLIVLGTHGRNLFSSSFFGSTARKVVLSSNVPVVTVKSR